MIIIVSISLLLFLFVVNDFSVIISIIMIRIIIIVLSGSAYVFTDRDDSVSIPTLPHVTRMFVTFDGFESTQITTLVEAPENPTANFTRISALRFLPASAQIDGFSTIFIISNSQHIFFHRRVDFLGSWS